MKFIRENYNDYPNFFGYIKEINEDTFITDTDEIFRFIGNSDRVEKIGEDDFQKYDMDPKWGLIKAQIIDGKYSEHIDD